MNGIAIPIKKYIKQIVINPQGSILNHADSSGHQMPTFTGQLKLLVANYIFYKLQNLFVNINRVKLVLTEC